MAAPSRSKETASRRRQTKAELQEEIESLKARNAELERAVKDLDKLHNLARLGTWSWDLHSGQVQWSSQMFEITGVDPDTRPLTIDAFSSRLHPEDRERWQRNFKKLLRGQIRSLVEYRLIRPNGDLRYVTSIRHPIPDAQGNPRRMVGLLHDVTEQRQSQSLYARVLRTMTEGFQVLDREGTIVEANESLCRTIGYTRDQVVGRNIAEFTESRDRLVVVEGLRRFRMSGGGRFEMRYRHDDGRPLDFDVSISFHEIDGGRWYCFLRDVTGRKRVDAALRRSEARLRDIAEASSDWFWETDESLRFHYISHRFEEVTGMSTADLIGHSLEEIADRAEGPSPGAFRFSLEARFPFREMRYKIRGPDKRCHYLALNGKPALNEHGAFVGYRGTGSDITSAVQAAEAQRLMMEEAQLANRAKSEFLANMSHELRTPLNAIIGFSEIMMNETFGPIGNPVYPEYAADIHEGGTHLLSLINDILDLSKIEAGKVELAEEQVRLNELIQAAVRIIMPKLKEARLSLDTQLPEEDVALLVDPRVMKQILLNLLSNAVKFTEPDGRITIAARFVQGRQLAIDVTDTGIGIDETDMEKVMQPFGQAEAAYDRSKQGTGLGLPLVNSLIKLHDGRFDLQSVKEKGTRARIYLPADRVRSLPGAAAGELRASA